MTAASIDIGSNTVLMLIAEINEDRIKPLKEIQRITRIAEGLLPGGKVSTESAHRLMNVMNEYLSLMKNYRCERIFISATSAFRKADNREELKSKIENLFGSEVRILSGEEEAELAFLGTMDYNLSNNYRLVIDIGGGSTEIIYGRNKTINFRKSFDIGVVSLSEKFFKKNKPTESELISAEKLIFNTFNMLPNFENAPGNSVALAGTPIAIACIKEGKTFYDEQGVEGTTLLIEEISDIYRYLSAFSPEELLVKYPEILKGREDLILSGTSILLILLKLLNVDKVLVSIKGIRYGALVKNLRTY